jgi:5-methylcytosine-specific restriction endonuclease McrA
MGYDRDQLDRIFHSTAGRCHLCHRLLARKNYGASDARGAWEVDHSVAKARGGSDHGNNLKPAHIACNRSKQEADNRAIRRTHGHTRSPLSTKAVRAKRTRNAVIGGTSLALIGGAAFGPLGFIAGVVVGGIVGHDVRVE